MHHLVYVFFNIKTVYLRSHKITPTKPKKITNVNRMLDRTVFPTYACSVGEQTLQIALQLQLTFYLLATACELSKIQMGNYLETKRF